MQYKTVSTRKKANRWANTLFNKTYAHCYMLSSFHSRACWPNFVQARLASAVIRSCAHDITWVREYIVPLTSFAQAAMCCSQQSSNTHTFKVGRDVHTTSSLRTLHSRRPDSLANLSNFQESRARARLSCRQVHKRMNTC